MSSTPALAPGLQRDKPESQDKNRATAADSVTRYELPPQGISLLGYITRRMHKTARLLPVSDLLGEGRSAEALAQVALYAAAASASYGPAYYQPRFNRVGETIVEADPATGARVTVRLEAESPHLRIAYWVELPDGGRFTGTEAITGTTVGLHGLGMPAPSQFEYNTAAGDYSAHLRGVITSELLPGLFTTARIRAQGALQLSDSMGNSGTLTLARSGRTRVVVSRPGGPELELRVHLAGG